MRGTFTNSQESHTAIEMWLRLPALLRGILAGALMAAAGTLPWALLVSLNVKYGSLVPWAVIPTAFYLLFYWRYARGEGWPRPTAEVRRSSCRANRLPENVWGSALFAGILGLAAVVLLQRVMARLVALPQQESPDLSQIPLVTVTLLVIMSAIVAGVAEEVSFRGYMQKPIEERHGPVVAILTAGTFFGFAHFSHPEVTLVLLPYYIAVAAVYGALAYFTDSVYPSMALHAGGNILGSLDFFTSGRSEWQSTPSGSGLVWETGTDPTFWFMIAALLFVGGAAVWAFGNLRTACLLRPDAAALPSTVRS